MIVVGIDPGSKTGAALYSDGKLTELHTQDTLTLLGWLAEIQPGLVVIEDSTLTSYLFTAPGVSHAAAMKVARNVGEVDAYCKQIKAVCGARGIAYRSISPKDKGAKIKAEQFNGITGWQGASNQHERDAAMVAWRFRSTR
jgi:predicted RNase H-like nuclease (RuvC/YqgF family)